VTEVFADGMPLSSAMDGVRYSAEHPEWQPNRIRGRNLPVPTLSKPYSEEEVNEILAELGVTASDKGGRLDQLTELRKRRDVNRHVVDALLMRELMARS
jgi:hypothetical protein